MECWSKVLSGQTRFFDHFAILIDDRDVGELVYKIQSCEKHAILIHGSISPCLAATKVDCEYLVSQ